MSRLGVVVSKRQVGKAHARNRVKRLLREYFRTHRAMLRSVLDLVVVAKKGSAALDGAAVHRELDAALREWLGSSPPVR